MAQFTLDTGDGRKTTVDAPAGSTREQVIDRYNQALQRQLDAPRIADENRLQQEREARRRAGDAQMAAYKPTIMDYVAEVPKGLVGGAAGMLESGALGIAALLPEEAENVVRDGIKYVGGAAQEYVEPTQNAGDSVPRKFSEALGSFAGLAGVFAANPVAGIATAVGAGVGEASERARAADATQEERNLAALLGVLPGALELVPINRFVKGVKLLRKGESAADAGSTVTAVGSNTIVTQNRLIANRIKRAGLEGGIEGAQETASSIAQNMIEQGYNPEKGTFDGSSEAAGYGFSVGAFAKTMLDLATPRTRGEANADVDSEEKQSTTIRTQDQFADVEERSTALDDRMVDLSLAERIKREIAETGEVSSASMQELRNSDMPFEEISEQLAEAQQSTGLKQSRPKSPQELAEERDILGMGADPTTEAVPVGDSYGGSTLGGDQTTQKFKNTKSTAESTVNYDDSGTTDTLYDRAVQPIRRGIQGIADRQAKRDAEIIAKRDKQTKAKTDLQANVKERIRQDNLSLRVGNEVAQGLESLRPEAQMDLATDPKRTAEERAQSELFPEQVREDALGRETLREDAPTTDDVDQSDPYRSDLLSFLPDGSENARRRKADQQEVDLTERSDAQTDLKQLSAQETADAKQVTDRLAETDVTRTKVLQDTIANAGELRRPEALRKMYEDALTAAGVSNAKATPQEVVSLKRASDAIRAKSPTPNVDNIIVPPELEVVTDPRQTDMETQVAPKPVTPTQASFAGMGRKAKLGTPPMRPGQDTSAIVEPTVEPRIINEKFLNGLSIRPQAAVRKRTMGKDFNDPAVRADIANHAGLKSTPLEAKNQINRLLDDTDTFQDSIFDKKEPPNKRAKSDAKPNADKTKPSDTKTGGAGNADAGQQRKSDRQAPAAADTDGAKSSDRSGVGSSSGSSSKSGRGTSKGDTTLDKANAKREADAAAFNAAKKRKEEVKKEVKNVDPNRNKATAERLVSAAKGTSASDADSARRNAIGSGTTDPDAPKMDLPPKPKAPVTTPVSQRKDRPTSADYLVEKHSKRNQAFQDELQENSDLRYSKNPFSEADNAEILALLDKKLKDVETKGDLNLVGVRAYLSRFPNPADGMRLAVEDVATQNPMATVDGVGAALAELGKNLTGVGRSKIQEDTKGEFPSKQPSQAERLIAWVRANLSAEANNILTKMQTKAQDAVIRSVLIDPANVKVIAQFNKLREASDRRQKGIDSVLGSVIKPQDLIDDGVITVKEADELFIWKNDKYYLALSSDAVVGLDVPAHSSVVNALKNGNLRGALLFVSQTSPNKQMRQLARKFADVTGNTKVVIKKDLKLDGKPVAGLFEPRTNTITLDADAGINLHTLMHEMSHAAGSAAIDDKSSQLAIKLNELFKRVRGSLSRESGIANLQEFFAEAMANSEFRSELSAINMKGEPVSALQRFFNIMQNFLRKFTGAPSVNLTALQQIDSLTDALLAPAPQNRNASPMGMMDTTRKGIQGFMSGFVDGTQRAVSEGSRKELKNDTKDFFTQTISKNGKNLLMGLSGSQTLGDIAQAVGLGNLGYDLDKVMAQQRGAIMNAEAKVKDQIEAILTNLNRGDKTVVEKRTKALNTIIYDTNFGATIFQVDPNDKRSEYLNKKGETKIDAEGNKLVDIWDAQRKHWNDMGPEGQKVFNDMRKVYEEQYATMKEVLFKQVDDSLGDTDTAKQLKNTITKQLFDKSKLKVYFPLLREGKFVLRYDVKNIDPAKRIANVLQTFETAAERDDAKAIIEANSDYENVDTSDGDLTLSQMKSVPSVFVQDTLSVLKKAKVPDSVQKEVLQLFIKTLPETSFAKALQGRKGTPGYMQDSVLALKSKAYNIASQAQKIKYGAAIRALELKIKDAPRPKDPPAAGKTLSGKILRSLEKATLADFDAVKTEMYKRAAFAREGAKNKNFEAIGRRLNQAAFIYTIGFNASSAMVNLSQIPLFVAPYLGGQYGYKKTHAAIKSAYGNVINSKSRNGSFNSLFEYYKRADDGTLQLRDRAELNLPDGAEGDAKYLELGRMTQLVDAARGRGLLQSSALAESMGLTEYSRIAKGGRVGRAMDNVSVLSATLFNHGEQMNRQVTLMASFNLALDAKTGGKPETATAEQIDAAVEDAIYNTQQTNGGTFLESAPRITQEHIGRVAGMYKSYGMQMYYTMMKTAKVAFDGDKGDLFGPKGSLERRTAWKQLIGLHGTAMLFAGVQGLPLYGAVRLITNLFFLDDEEDDFDTIVRKHIGEGWYKGGITAATGLDVSTRVALTGLLLQQNRYNNDPSLEENLGFYLGGPALSVAKRLGRGMDDLYNGEIERGIENLLPAGVANAYKSSFGRYQQDGGAFTRRQDPIYDDISAGEQFFWALGIAPKEYTLRQDKAMISKKIDTAVNKKRSDLLKKYYVASRMYDSAEMLDISTKMMDFSLRHPDAAIDRDTVERSMKKHATSSEKMYNGVSFSSLYGDTIRMMLGEFEQ